MGVRLYLSESSTVLKNQFTMVAIPDCFCNLGSLIGLFGATFAIFMLKNIKYFQEVGV